MIAVLALILVCLVQAFTPRQALIAREVMRKKKPPPFVTVTDAVLADGFAFTDESRKRIYVDFAQFRDAPTSLANTINHEVVHTKGGEHNSIPGDIMSYVLTLDESGAVVNDDHEWD